MWDDNDSIVETESLATVAASGMGTQRKVDGDNALSLLVSHAEHVNRDPKRLIVRGKQVGSLLGAAGFYRFPAGGASVEGASIDLAEALAQEWGAIAYEVQILSTDNLSSGGRKIHLRARVTDLKSLVLASMDGVVSTSPPPGKFAGKTDQQERWHTMQVQSAASKIARNAILRILPAWYVGPALAAAIEADAQSATRGKSLPEARKGAIEHLATLGISQAELESFLGQPVDLWAASELSTLRDLAGSLRSGRTSVEAFRASLSEPVAATPELPSSTGRSALGLGAKKPAQRSAAEPLLVPAAQPDGP